MLEGKGVTKRFGGLVALQNVDFHIDEKEIVGLIGPNGAGKTTLFNIITGIYHPTSGALKFNGTHITKLRPDQICHLGIVKTFQNPCPFIELSTVENCMVGVLFGKKKSMTIREARKEALQLLEFVGILNMADVQAKNLPLIGRRMLEIAGALGTNPKVILLDEVLAGLNPTETLHALQIIRGIRDRFGIAVFWVEHVMKAIMEVAERIIVLNYGVKIGEGTPKEVASDTKVIDAYLGETSE